MTVHLVSTSDPSPCGARGVDFTSSARSEITCPGCNAWIAAQDARADRDLTTLALARAYRDACEAVQPAWLKMIRLSAGTPERRAAIEAVNLASSRAREAREALLVHVRGDASEVGR